MVIDQPIAMPEHWWGLGGRERSTVTEDEKQRYHGEQLVAYRGLFSSMDGAARAIWFFTMDESEILSFLVGADESPEAASARHGIKLAAMADALEQVYPDTSSDQVIDLRRLAAKHAH